jgi:hypothetical protein
MEKVCSKCLKSKSLSDFSKWKNDNDLGVQSWCKVCSAQYRGLERVKVRSLFNQRHRRKGTEYKKKEAEQAAKRRLIYPKRQLLESAKTRAKKQNVPFTITEADFEIPLLCPIFQVPMIKRTMYAPSLDKVVPSLGYIPGNIMIISKLANMMKFNATLEQLKLFSEYWLKYEQDCK